MRQPPPREALAPAAAGKSKGMASPVDSPWPWFLLSLLVVMAALLIGPRIPDAQQVEYCVVNVHLPGPFGADEGVVGDEVHPEGQRPLGHEAPDPAEYDRVIAINQTGVFNTVKPAIERRTSQVDRELVHERPGAQSHERKDQQHRENAEQAVRQKQSIT